MKLILLIDDRHLAWSQIALGLQHTAQVGVDRGHHRPQADHDGDEKDGHDASREHPARPRRH